MGTKSKPAPATEKPVKHRLVSARRKLAGIATASKDRVRRLRGNGGNRDAESKRLLSADRYRRLFEQNLAGVFISRLEGGLIDCNDSFAHILGFASREEMIEAKDFSPYAHPDQRARYIEQLKQTNSLTNFELNVRRRDGSEAWVLENITLVEEPGSGNLILGTLIDITQRKRTERLQAALYRISDCANSVNELQQLYKEL